MKIILSRKGFDSQYGGQPSPILPDGALLSIPIPYSGEVTTYSSLYHNGKSYYEIIKELKPNSPIQPAQSCHLDPDLRWAAMPRQQSWKPIFGQMAAAQTHLVNQQVAVGDIFLFFGWFRQAQLTNGKYAYVKGSPDVHLIYGYLQIGEIYNYGDSLPQYTSHHPHARGKLKETKSNCIYVASDTLSFDATLPGAGNLRYKPNLVLTRKGMSRSRWELPSIFRTVEISYHTRASFREDYFQSAAQGQEFVINGNEPVIQWAKDLIVGNEEDGS